MDKNQNYMTKQRQELVQWFKERAPSFVDFYVAAIKLLYEPKFPARVNFICHAIRDIYRYLPASLGMKTQQRPSEVFPGMVKNLENKWERYPPNTNTSNDKLDSDYPVSPQVYREVEKIIKKRIEIKEQPTVGKKLAIALFRSLDRREDEFIPPRIIKAFDEEHDYFVTKAHVPLSKDEIPNDEGLIKHFEAFERAFHALVCPYFSGNEELDEILQDTNSIAG